MAPCFRPPFGEGSSRTVRDLTRPARILDFVLRKTLLPRTGYRDGFTRIQLWLVAHLISQTPFDLWDLIVSEIEDTISNSFRRRCQLPRGTRSSGAVPDTEEQQDIAIGAFADAEVEGEFDFASDSSDDDYQPPVSDLPQSTRPRGRGLFRCFRPRFACYPRGYEGRSAPSS